MTKIHHLIKNFWGPGGLAVPATWQSHSPGAPEVMFFGRSGT